MAVERAPQAYHEMQKRLYRIASSPSIVRHAPFSDAIRFAFFEAAALPVPLSIFGE
jgi:hypothetical protein